MTWAPSYCTSAELKSFIRVNDTDDDVQIGLAITAASRAVDRAANRQFGVVAVAEDRYYTARWDRERYRWVVDIDDVMSTSGAAVAVDLACDQTYSTTLTAYDFGPRNAAQKGRPWTELVVRQTSTSLPNLEEDGVKITALWGWSAVPDAIKQATLLQASRVLSRRDSPYGVAGSPTEGSEMRLLAKLDPDVDLIVRTYARPWGAAILPSHNRRVIEFGAYGYGFPYRWGG